MSEDMRVSCFIEKEHIRPWGLFGGEPGKNSGIRSRKTAERRSRRSPRRSGRLQRQVLRRLPRPGDSIRMITSGRRGLRRPLERAFDRIEEDVRQGFMSKEQAEAEYTMRFRAGSTDVDVSATEALRSEGGREAETSL